PECQSELDWESPTSRGPRKDFLPRWRRRRRCLPYYHPSLAVAAEAVVQQKYALELPRFVFQVEPDRWLIVVVWSLGKTLKQRSGTCFVSVLKFVQSRFRW